MLESPNLKIHIFKFKSSKTTSTTHFQATNPQKKQTSNFKNNSKMAQNLDLDSIDASAEENNTRNIKNS